ncbi:DUF1430 domain-containing protein [Bacillus sp. FSL R12-0074]|uniref:DUF1430 domain-containing protein n=1 Tax=Bacillus sp. FSL R12-0074 TaxID=2954664 RepID=UPI000D31A851
MKKVLFSLYIVIFLLSFFVFVEWILNKQENFMKQAGKENSIVMTFNESILEIDRNKFFSVLFNVSDSYGANVFKPSYSDVSSTEYIYLTHDQNSYFSNFSLLDGEFPNDTKMEDFYLSTFQNEKVTGKLFSYTNENKFHIKPLRKFPNDKLITGNYIVTLQDINKVDSFINSLEKKLNLKIKYSNYEFQEPIGSFGLQVMPLILLYVLSILMTIYYYFLQYKNFSVQLLNGYGAINVWKNYLFEICVYYFAAMFLSTGFIAVVKVGSLLFTLEWLEILRNYFLYQSIIGIMFCFIVSLLFIRVGNIDISSSLKNKKPLKKIQILNGFTKVLFSGVILYLIFVSYSSFSMLYRYYETNAGKWNVLKSYGVMNTSAPTPNGNQPKAVLDLFKKHYELFKYTNDRGAILVKVSDAYEAKEVGVDIPNQSKFAEKIIRINNNFLKLNPIKSVDNKVVKIDENNEELIILVPEKYQSEERELRAYLEDEYAFQKYGAKNSFLQDIGEPVESVKSKFYSIIWVKDGQSYFTFSNHHAKDTNNYFYDGIGVVLTNKNGNEGALYDTVVGNSGYFIKLTDKKVFYNSVKSEVERLGLQDLYPTVYNAYDANNFEVQEHMKRMYVFVFVLCITLFVYFAISIFTTMNYLEQNKYRHTIQTIYGYAYFEKHKIYLMVTNSIWIISTFIIFMFGKFDFGCIIFFVFLLENMLTYLLIKRSERKKMIQIIKEG